MLSIENKPGVSIGNYYKLTLNGAIIGLFPNHHSAESVATIIHQHHKALGKLPELDKFKIQLVYVDNVVDK